MILENKINIRKGLEQLLSSIPPSNPSSIVIEKIHTSFIRNADMTINEKLWFLDSALQQLSIYHAIPEVNEWLQTTTKFFNENKMSVETVTILENLKKSKDSNFYVEVATILETILSTNDEKTISKSIVESGLTNYKWIDGIRYLLENAIKITRGVNFAHPDYDVTDIYSPIETITENGFDSFVFYSNGRVLKINETTGFSEYPLSATSAEFLPMIKVVENLKVTNKSISTTISGKEIRIEESINGDKRILLEDVEIPANSLASTIFGLGSFLNSVRETADNLVTAFESFDYIYNLDFGKKIVSRKHNGVCLNAFRFGDHVALQKVNKIMNENSFIVYTDAEDAIKEANLFIGFDLTSLFSDLVEVSREQKRLAEDKVRELQESVAILQSRRDSFRNKAILADALDTVEIKEALQALENGIDEKISELESLLPNYKKHSKVMKGYINTNFGQKEVTFQSADFINEEKSIKVSNGESLLYIDKQLIKVE